MKKSLRLTLSTLGILSTMAPAASLQRQPGRAPSSPITGITRGATFDAPFSDLGNAHAKQLAAQQRISIGEATRRLSLIHKAAQLAHRLERDSPNRFAGMEVIETQGTIQFKAHFVGGDQADNRSLLAKGSPDPLLQGVLSLAPSALSQTDLRATGDRLIAEVNLAGVVSAVAVNPVDGVVHFLAKDPAAVRAAIAQGKIKPPAGFVIEQSRGILLTEALIAGAAYNGTVTECSTGFSVIENNTTRGVTTAGHCDNNPAQYNATFASHYGDPSSFDLSFQQEWITNNSDVQWSTAAAPNTIEAQFWNGTTAVTVSGVAQTLTGETLCKFGRETGETCGTVDGTWTWDPGFTGYFLRMVTPSSGTPLTLAGDSGGPVYSGSVAKGWVHGKDDTGNAYFTPVSEFYKQAPNMLVLCVC